jgi:Ca-activated chloride channel homolog
MNTRRLPLWPLVAVTVLSVLTTTVFAKSAEDYFHGAAYLYVAGKIQEASIEADEGLRLNPGDEKLRALADQLRKMKDQQRGGQGQNGQKGKEKKDGQDQNKQEGKNPDGDKGKDQDKNRKGENGDQKSDGPDDKKNDRQKPGEGEDGKDGKKGERDGTQGTQPPKMTEAEAQRLLNSFADDEKKEQAERRKVIRARGGTEQDW